MKLIYAKLKGGNFGDDMNPWMWDRLMPGVLNDEAAELFIGIGSILSSDLDGPARKIVFGTGTGYGAPPKIDDHWRVYCVRGPGTAERLGLDPKLAIADAAYLIRKLELARPPVRYAAAYMPHHASVPDVDWRALCERAGVHCIDPTGSVEECLDEILASKVVIAEAMHGAILADALRIPWVPIRYGYRSLDFKWHDWCSSMGLRYAPIDLPKLLQVDLAAGELAGRMIRRGAAAFGVGKDKWARTPIRRSSERELDAAAALLRKLAGGGGQLSPDSAFSTTMERLDSRFADFLADVEAGVFPTAGRLRRPTPA